MPCRPAGFFPIGCGPPGPRGFASGGGRGPGSWPWRRGCRCCGRWPWAASASPPRGILCALYLTILALVVVTDLEHRRIYDAVMLPAIALAALAAPVSPWLEGGAIGAWGMGVGAFIFFFGLAVISRGGIGGGDATLAAFIGLITGFPQGLRALSWGVLLAGAFSLGLLLSRRGTLKTAFPYGPFLALGGAAALFGF